MQPPLILRYEYAKRKDFDFLLASDIHMEDPYHDEALFREDFDWAKEVGAEIFVNGDHCRAIAPDDRKRYVKGQDLLTYQAQANEMAHIIYEKYLPYVDNIRLLGYGNHESSWIKYKYSDFLQMAVVKLNAHRPKDNPIVLGGYRGWIRMLFRHSEKGGQGHKFDTYYCHGTGAAAEVTKGMIDLERSKYRRADLIWLGHKHKRTYDGNLQEEGINDAGRVYERDRVGIITGAYMSNQNIREYDDQSIAGYIPDFVEERTRTPQGRGGCRLKIFFKCPEKNYEMFFEPHFTHRGGERVVA